jgi:hypothetical protein
VNTATTRHLSAIRVQIFLDSTPKEEIMRLCQPHPSTKIILVKNGKAPRTVEKPDVDLYEEPLWRSRDFCSESNRISLSMGSPVAGNVLLSY